MTISTSTSEKVHWTLRIACAMCFIGHGAWGIITKAEWLPFFHVVGISDALGWKLMPLIGIMDISLGIWILFRPTRFVMVYLIVWGTWTALLRPLSGMGWWEFLERAGNYGAPLAFLVFSGMIARRADWFSPVRIPEFSQIPLERLKFVLKTAAMLLLVGHGGFEAFQHKPMLMDHWQAVGLPVAETDPIAFGAFVGWFEILLGLAIFFKPTPGLALCVVGWKLLTESLYVIHGPFCWQIFEFIERGGSYGVPLALYFLTNTKRK